MNSNAFIIINLITFIFLSFFHNFLKSKNYTLFSSLVINVLIFLGVLIIINNLNSVENLVCNKGNHIMKPDIEQVYGDKNKARLPHTEIGGTVCKYPYDKRYIPRMNEKWCLKNVLD